jgi:hypothetical protein
MAKTIITIVCALVLTSCMTTKTVVDSSLMSGNQNPAGTAVGVGFALATDAVIFLVDSIPEDMIGNGELEDMEEDWHECPFCEYENTLEEVQQHVEHLHSAEDNINPADPMED